MKLHIKIYSISSVFKFQHVKEIVFNAYEWEFLRAMNCIIPYLQPQVKPIKYLNRASCGTQPACLNNITFSHFPVQMLFSKFTSLPALQLHAVMFLTLSLSMWFPLGGIHTSFPLFSSWLTAIYHSSRLSLWETFSDIPFWNKHTKRHLPRLLGD